MNYQIRAAKDSDLPFIFSTWLNGLRHGWNYGRSQRARKGEDPGAIAHDSALYRQDPKTKEYFEVFIEGFFSLIARDNYMRKYHTIIERILNLPDTITIVACLAEDPDVIIGYAVAGAGNALHYVHVKQAFRRFGVASKLCADQVQRITHLTKNGHAFRKAKFPSAIFDPFL